MNDSNDFGYSTMTDSEKLEVLIQLHFEKVWFNATEVALMYNKKVKDYLDKPNTAGYITAMCKRHELSDVSLLVSEREDGIWLSPRLMLDFGRWVDVEFDIWLNCILVEAIKNGAIDH